MGSIQNPVGRGPTDPLEPTRGVEPVGRDRPFREERRPKQSGEKPPDGKLGVFAFLLQAFHQLVDFVLQKRHSSKEIAAYEHLLSLKAIFETLKMEDRSQDTALLEKLSQIWRHLLEDCLHLEAELANSLMKKLVKKIQDFPEGQTHTFGYYLSEYIDEKWIPFPYMELIQTIHLEHEKDPPSSSLSQWSSLIDEILVLLKPDE